MTTYQEQFEKAIMKNNIKSINKLYKNKKINLNKKQFHIGTDAALGTFDLYLTPLELSILLNKVDVVYYLLNKYVLITPQTLEMKSFFETLYQDSTISELIDRYLSILL